MMGFIGRFFVLGLLANINMANANINTTVPQPVYGGVSVVACRVCQATARVGRGRANK